MCYFSFCFLVLVSSCSPLSYLLSDLPSPLLEDQSRHGCVAAATLAGYTSKGDERGRRLPGELGLYQTLHLDETEFHASPATRQEHKGKSGVLWQDLANVAVQRPTEAPCSPPCTLAGSALIQLHSKS